MLAWTSKAPRATTIINADRVRETRETRDAELLQQTVQVGLHFQGLSIFKPKGYSSFENLLTHCIMPLTIWIP